MAKLVVECSYSKMYEELKIGSSPRRHQQVNIDRVTRKVCRGSAKTTLATGQHRILATHTR